MSNEKKDDGWNHLGDDETLNSIHDRTNEGTTNSEF